MKTSFSQIDDQACDACQQLGAICLGGAFSDWVQLLRGDWFPVLRSRANTGEH